MYRSRLIFVTATVRNDRLSSAPRSDAELVTLVTGGDLAALGGLYDRYAGILLPVAYRLLMSKDDAEDVVHDVFVGLPEALRRYEERGALGAWLRKVTARVALMRLRSESARN